MAYATAQQWFERHDVRLINQLVSNDDNVTVSRIDLLTNDNVVALLNDASGEMDAALLTAGLYQSADLSGLTGNALFHRIRICVDIAMSLAFGRRPGHEPELAGQPQPYLALLRAVTGRQAALIARWMGVGFIHGVMNTDNVAISGETIDYGPCAFMDAYHPDTVFSSIDQFGRYAFANQPRIAVWNLAQLATALLALIPDRDEGIEVFTTAVNGFADRFDAEWQAVLARKLGLGESREGDASLAFDLLNIMAENGADFTRTFRALSGPDPSWARDEFIDPTVMDGWLVRWRARLAQEDIGADERVARMRAVNPARIPRNHRIEQGITRAVDGDYDPFHALMAALADPFAEAPELAAYEAAPEDGEHVTRTFCGT